LNNNKTGCIVMVQPVFKARIIMVDPILQSAYCATFGDTCEDPTLIQDSLLITDDIKSELENIDGVKILTLSTGNEMVKQTMVTLQLDIAKTDIGYYEVFKYQLTGNSNRLYKAEIVYIGDDAYLIVSTLNSERPDLNANGRLQQWLTRLPSMIKTTNETTTTFIPDVKEIHTSLSESYDNLKTEIGHVTDVIDNGTENYTEEEQVKVILGSVVEDIAVSSLGNALQITTPVSNEDTSAVIEPLVTTPLSNSTETSKFDIMQSEILSILSTLDTSSPDTVKAQILDTINSLTSIPQDIRDSYINSIYSKIDGFPFTSVDSIIGSVTGLGKTLVNDYFSEFSDLYTNVEGAVLSTANTLLEATGISAAKKLFNDISTPGNLKNLVNGMGTHVVDTVLGQLPIDDYFSILADVKGLTSYLDFDSSDAGGMFEEYSQKIINMGLDSSGINGVVSDIKKNIDSIGTIIDYFDDGITGVGNTFKQLTAIGPMLEKQVGKVSDYFTDVSSVFTNEFKGISNKATGAIDSVTGAPEYAANLFTDYFSDTKDNLMNTAKDLSKATGMSAGIDCFC